MKVRIDVCNEGENQFVLQAAQSVERHHPKIAYRHRFRDFKRLLQGNENNRLRHKHSQNDQHRRNTCQ